MDTYILVIVLEMLGDSEYTLRYIGKIFSIPFPPRAFIFLKAKELSGLQCLDDLGRYKIPFRDAIVFLYFLSRDGFVAVV